MADGRTERSKILQESRLKLERYKRERISNPKYWCKDEQMLRGLSTPYVRGELLTFVGFDYDSFNDNTEDIKAYAKLFDNKEFLEWKYRRNAFFGVSKSSMISIYLMLKKKYAIIAKESIKQEDK